MNEERLIQQFKKEIEKKKKRTNYGKISKNRYSPNGGYNQALDDAIEILLQIISTINVKERETTRENIY